MTARRSLLALAALAPGAALAQALSPAQRAEVLDLLRRALREDPSILREAIAALEAAEERDRAEAQLRAIDAHRAALFNDAELPVKGNPQGRLAIAEFFDARCGFCKRLHPVMEQLLAEDRDLRVVMIDLPILGPNSVLAARAMLAAQRQNNRHARLADALLRLSEEPTEPVIRREAERAGLDWARLRRDMDDPAIQRRIQRNLELAQALGVGGTPALVIGRQLIPGAVDLPALRAAVAQARQG